MNDQQLDTQLRNALDAADGIRRRVSTGGWLAAAITMAAYLNLWYVHRTTHDVARLVVAGITALTCLLAWTTFAVILVVVRMTKRILRAIDLTTGR